MDGHRQSMRQQCLLRGRVYFNNGRCSLDCLIRDISDEGARIAFFDPVNIPDVIRLYIPKKNRTMDASVQWRRGLTIGVTFTQFMPGAQGVESACAASRVSGSAAVRCPGSSSKQT
jgi:hypothetical protein